MSFDVLAARIDRIRELKREVEVARARPGIRRRRVEALQAAYPHYGDKLSDEDKELFAQARSILAAKEERQFLFARDRELKRLAAELDKLRADLPELATAARFSLLDDVAEMRASDYRKDLSE